MNFLLPYCVGLVKVHRNVSPKPDAHIQSSVAACVSFVSVAFTKANPKPNITLEANCHTLAHVTQPHSGLWLSEHIPKTTL